MHWRKIHLPSLGIVWLLIGGFLRALAFLFHWPLLLVVLSQVILLMSVTWILVYDFFPIFLNPFYAIRKNFRRRYSFFLILLALFALMQLMTYFLPSGRTKDLTTTIAFLSFISAIVWGVGSYVLLTFTPVVKLLKYKPREPERVTFADVLTSMAVILTPTVALSFFFTPPGLGNGDVTPYQIFLTSVLTSVFIGAYVYLFVIRPKVFTWRQLGLRNIAKEDLGRSFVLFLFVTVMVFVIQSLLQRLGVPLNQYSFANKQGAYLALASTVFLTPFIEELYFRGFLFRGLLLHQKPWLAYTLSAGLFAILHPPLVVVIEVFCIGLLLAYLVRETKSIWPGVALHALNNAVVFGYLLFKP